MLPQFHRTFVAKNACGLLIQYALEAPPSGLGLRRVQWHCHAANIASRKLADKLLFTYEGTKRFERLVEPGKPDNGYDCAKAPNVTGKSLANSRDSMLLAHYCDEWDMKRELLQKIMDS